MKLLRRNATPLVNFDGPLPVTFGGGSFGAASEPEPRPAATFGFQPTQGRLGLTIGTLILSAVGITGLTTTAVLTDSKSVTANTVSTSTVTLTTSSTNAAITSSGMNPGDVVYAGITVTNGGSTPLRYALLSTSDATDNNTLAAQLQLAVVQNASCTSGTSFTTPLYNSVFGSVAGAKVLGDAAQGVQSGDRTLATGASEALCFRLTLPLSTTSTFAGRTTTSVLKFDAEQTANNP